VSTIRPHCRGHLRSILCDLRKSWKTGSPSIKKNSQQFLRHASYDACHATGRLSLWGTLSGQVPGKRNRNRTSGIRQQKLVKHMSGLATNQDLAAEIVKASVFCVEYLVIWCYRLGRSICVMRAPPRHSWTAPNQLPRKTRILQR
jgi:hypothetical protein